MSTLYKGELKILPFDQLHIDSKGENSRGEILPYQVAELAEKIRTQGLLQTPLASPTPVGITTDKPYTLVCGFRRTLAQRDCLGLTEGPFTVRPMTLEEIIVANLEENIERENLNVIQEANGIARLMRLGKRREEIAKLLRKSPGWVQTRMYALHLPEHLRLMVAEGVLTTEHIRDLYSLRDPKAQDLYAKTVREKREQGYVGPIKLDRGGSSCRRNPANVARARSRQQIEDLIAYLQYENFPLGLYTRTLAWAAGNISDADLAEDLKELALEQGREWELPEFGFPKPGIISFGKAR